MLYLHLHVSYTNNNKLPYGVTSIALKNISKLIGGNSLGKQDHSNYKDVKYRYYAIK